MADETAMKIESDRSLDQVIRYYTMEMFRWPREDCRPEPVAVGILPGQCFEDRVAEVSDPACTLVCNSRRKYPSCAGRLRYERRSELK